MIDSILAKGLLPDFLIRLAIRRLNKRRLKEIGAGNIEYAQARKMELVAALRQSEIAVLTEKANAQHYEIPAEFFALVLGENRKYSSCYYPTGKESLSTAEKLMLTETCDMADLKDGQAILELGCGWGSLSLFMAARYPKANITAVSNSKSQKIFIDGEIKKRGLSNLKIITTDVNILKPGQNFDRVVSVEMFEHLRNYDMLFKRIHTWLKPKGKLFIHIFAHRNFPYLFEDKDGDDWMSRYFFSGGIMPSSDLFTYFSSSLNLIGHRIYNGTHYHLTAEDWLKNMDANQDKVEKIFAGVYGKQDAKKWQNYWRIFFLAVSELFRTKKGEEWVVIHYLFEKP